MVRTPCAKVASFTVGETCAMQVQVYTNCPRGGDAGHGGRTTFVLSDRGGTDLAVDGSSRVGGEVRVELGGDGECRAFIECLRFAAAELQRQLEENNRENR